MHSTAHSTTTRPVTILLVEDDTDLLDAYAFALIISGYDVLKADSGDAALTATERCGRYVDIVLTAVRCGQGNRFTRQQVHAHLDSRILVIDVELEADKLVLRM